MPTVNFYFKESPNREMDSLTAELRVFIAEKLTCGDIRLSPGEVSIRFIQISGGRMIGDTEIEVVAASFPERVERQDKICVEIANYVKEKAPYLGEVQCWLKLSELGHSWTENKP